MRKIATGCYAVLLVLLAALPAVASQPAPPQYVSSEPSDGEVVHEAPDRVEVTFDQPLDQASSLTITDGCDRRVDDGTTEVSGTSMSIGLEKKPAGKYHVEYLARGLGGLTGEQSGHFTFTSHGGDACKGDPSGGHHGGGTGGNGGSHNGGHGGSRGGHQGVTGGTEHGSTGSGTGAIDHSSAAGTTDHSSAPGATHTEQGPSATSHGGSDSSGGDEHSSGNGPHATGITSSDTERNLLPRATSTTLLISLVLCAALGVMGGTVLRATSAR